MNATAVYSLLAILAAGPPAKDQAGLFADFRGARDEPTYRAAMVAEAPAVDGVMDKAYQSAEAIDLVFINGDKARPASPTRARAVCTKDALYVFFRCGYTDPKAVAFSRRTRDSDVWQDNSVEVFLEPTGKGSRNYYQVIVNPGGTAADLLRRDPKAWNPKAVKVATKVAAKEWTAEIAIPFADLGLKAGKINKVWRMNLTRFNHAPAEDTSWCVLGDYSSHVPSRFGYLWLDAGGVMNVSAQEMQPWRRLFDGRTLTGWEVLDGEVKIADGAMNVPKAGARILLKRPLPAGDLAVAAEVYDPKQFRFMFSPDADNKKMGCYATFINLINESNVALMRGWEYWVPPLGWHLTIPHYGPCPMADKTWYRCVVHFRRDRIRLILNGRVLLETPNFYPKARRFGLHVIGGGKLRNVRMRKLVSAK